MDALRVAEIYARRGTADSYGSGYLIAPGRVLTACHVVAPALGGGKDAVCELRLVGDVEAGRTQWNAYGIAWQDETLDLALLLRTPESAAYAAGPSSLVPMARLPRTEVQPVCRGVGFPRLMYRDKRNQTQEIGGLVMTESLRAERLWQISITGPAPKSEDDWKGASGAALFCADQLFGVVTQTQRGFNDGVLVAQPLDPLLNNAAFLQALGLAGVPPADAFEAFRGSPAPARHDPKPWLALERLVYLVDRNIPVAELKKAVTHSINAADAPRTFVCAVPGDVEHEHFELIDLFRFDAWPALFQGRPNFKEIVTMDWATAALSVGHGLQQLRSQLHQRLDILDASPLDSAQRIAAALNRNVKPRAYCWEIHEAGFTPLQRELLLAWLAEWDEVCKAGLNDFVGLFFCFVFDAARPTGSAPVPAPSRWPQWARWRAYWTPPPLASLRDFARDHFDFLDAGLEAARWPAPKAGRDRERLRRVRLSDLAPCNRPQHLREWGVQLEVKHRWLVEHVAELERQFDGDQFSVRDLRAKLRQCAEPPPPPQPPQPYPLRS